MTRRGIGESATRKPVWVLGVSLLLGENFVGRQAWDVLRVLEALGADGGYPGKPSGLDARGETSCLAAKADGRGPRSHDRIRS
jgi:hypothetical protein